MALASELDLEKEQELRNSISLLETELSQVQNELASKEDESTKFSKMQGFIRDFPLRGRRQGAGWGGQQL